jgi:hypothetical protein
VEYHANRASEWEQHPEQFGAILAGDKPYGPTERFRFLGIEYSLRRGTRLAWKNNEDGSQTRLDIDKASDDELREFSKLASEYSVSKLERMQHWSWDIVRESFLGERFMPYGFSLGPSIGLVIVWIMRKLNIYYPSLQRWLNRTMMRDPFGASTVCSVDLLKELEPLKRPDIIRWADLKPGYVSPGVYIKGW